MKISPVNLYTINTNETKRTSNNTVQFCADFKNNENIKHIPDIKNLAALGININFSDILNTQTYSAEDLHQLFQAQLMPIKEAETEKLISKIQSNDISKEEAIEALNVLTQFGNMKSLVSLGEKFREMGIRCFYQEPIVSTNSAFNYLYNAKRIVKLGIKKEAFILDEAGLKYLENNPEKTKELINREDLIFIYPESWNEGINIFNQGKEPETDRIQQIIKEAKKAAKEDNADFNSSLKKIINSKNKKRAENLGITNIVTISEDKNSASIKSITENLSPYNISFEKTEKTVNAIAETVFPVSRNKAKRAKSLIIEYMVNNLQAYSPRRLGKTLQKTHELIADFCAAHKKADGTPFTEDDIVYIIPESQKSYNYINLQYALINNIDFNKFKSPDEMNQDNKIYVVLDDVIGSGDSMIWKSFKYAKKDFDELKHSHIIMAPVVSTKAGIEKIEMATMEKSRLGKDFVIVPKGNKINALEQTDFYKRLSSEDKEILAYVFASIQALNSDPYGGLGFDANGAAIIFPYMAPDNNATITSLFFDKLVPNKGSLKSLYKSSHPTVKKILDKIQMSN